MGKFVRKLENRNFLDPERAGGEGEACADALRNFATTCDQISVYRTYEGSPSAERVAVMVAAGKDRPDHVDFVVFDSSIPDEQGIASVASSGKTPDAAVNRRHVDLEIRTARNLCELVDAIQQGVTDGAVSLKRISKRDACRLLAAAIQDGEIDYSRLKPEMIEKLGPYLSEPR